MVYGSGKRSVARTGAVLLIRAMRGHCSTTRPARKLPADTHKTDRRYNHARRRWLGQGCCCCCAGKRCAGDWWAAARRGSTMSACRAQGLVPGRRASHRVWSLDGPSSAAARRSTDAPPRLSDRSHPDSSTAASFAGRDDATMSLVLSVAYTL